MSTLVSSQRLAPLDVSLPRTTKGDALFFFFFRVDEHRDYISGSYRWTRRVNEPRFYANATRANVVFLARFCTALLTPATFLSTSNSGRALVRAAIRGSSRSIIHTERRPPPILHIIRGFFSFSKLRSSLRTEGCNEIALFLSFFLSYSPFLSPSVSDTRSIKYKKKKLRAIR